MYAWDIALHLQNISAVYYEPPRSRQAQPAVLRACLATMWHVSVMPHEHRAWHGRGQSLPQPKGAQLQPNIWTFGRIAISLPDDCCPTGACRLLAQPPNDHLPGDACIYHYTWGSVFKRGSKEVWRFDKRDYTAAELALKVRRPHLHPGMTMPPDPAAT